MNEFFKQISFLKEYFPLFLQIIDFLGAKNFFFIYTNSLLE